MRGYLLIHIGGFRRKSDYAAQIFFRGDQTISVPDRLVEAPVYDREDLRWGEEGWAVGDNPRDRFCKWMSNAPKRRFTDYDEAVRFIYELRQRRKKAHEAYTLVYVSVGVQGKEQFTIVSSMDDIDAFEAQLLADQQAHNARQEQYAARQAIEHPCLDCLKEKYSRGLAWELSELLGVIRTRGESAAKESLPKATYYRYMKNLRDAGCLD